MKILNIAHGSLYALGAYTAATIAGAWLAAGYAAAGSYAMLALAALLVGAVMGPLLERGLLRWMYGKDEVVLLLITYAAFLILEDTIKLVWGVESKLLPELYSLPGNFQIGALAYPVYNLLLIAVAVIVGLAVAWTLYRTRQGKLLLAVIHDREISAAMGINVDRVYLVTFSVGAMLAGLGGALTAPTIAVSPGIGVEVILWWWSGAGEPWWGGARRAHGRDRALGHGALLAGSPALHDLFRDGRGSDRAAQGLFSAPETRKI
jgi:branched-chain amino acid transport system permease protein